jgi:hypothetical protein
MRVGAGCGIRLQQLLASTDADAGYEARVHNGKEPSVVATSVASGTRNRACERPPLADDRGAGWRVDTVAQSYGIALERQAGGDQRATNARATR